MAASHSTRQDYNPPRFKWTKCIAWASLGLVVLSVTLWGSATLIAQHRLDKLIASYRAVGEPVYAEDFNISKEVPAGENAWAFYMKASEAFCWPKRFSEHARLAMLMSRDCSYLEKYAHDVERYLNTNGLSLALVRRASTCRYDEPRLNYTQPLIHFRVSLAGRRDLSQLLKIAMDVAVKDGRHDELVRLLWESFRLERSCARGPSAVSTHLVAIDVGEFAYNAVEAFAHELNITRDPVNAAGHAASIDQLRRIIEELEDEDDFLQVSTRGMWRERADAIDAIAALMRSEAVVDWLDPIPVKYAWAIRPPLCMDVVHSSQILDEYQRLLAGSAYPALQVRTGLVNRVNAFSEYRVVDDAVPAHSWDTLLFFEFHFRAVRRMAKTALAIRMFEFDHGRRPQALDDLVPDYLNLVPLDPFARNGSSIRYLPAAKPAKLYSVGMDGVDDGGQAGRNPWGGVDRTKLDLVFSIDGDGWRKIRS